MLSVYKKDNSTILFAVNRIFEINIPLSEKQKQTARRQRFRFPITHFLRASRNPRENQSRTSPVRRLKKKSSLNIKNKEVPIIAAFAEIKMNALDRIWTYNQRIMSPLL